MSEIPECMCVKAYGFIRKENLASVVCHTVLEQFPLVQGKMGVSRCNPLRPKDLFYLWC